ncbi:MAG TPA: hypothetical protein PKA88_33090 [Polyangiaceae bacterium]|nr:hypothetical protein [Polyangiaceae bacterium]
MLRLRTCILFCVMLWASICPAGQSCHDGIKNGPESDVDCGGDCPPCALGKTCSSARDCVSGRCADGECVERVIPKGAAAPAGYETRTAFTDPGATARQAGIVFLSVGYAGAYVSALSLPGRLSWMYAPILGPWLTLNQVEEPELKGLIVADGAFQAGGAILIIGGLVSGGSQIVRAPDSAFVVTPSISPRMTGFNVAGHF